MGRSVLYRATTAEVPVSQSINFLSKTKHENDNGSALN